MGGYVSPLMMALWVTFIVFAYFAVLNVVTAVFVQNAIESGKSDRDMIHQSVLAQRRAFRALVARLFDLIDTNDSGEISLAELELCYHSDVIQAYFESLELEVESAWDLFKLLDIDDT